MIGRLGLIAQIILILLIISIIFIIITFEFLPRSFSSTTVLSEINGERVERVDGNKLVADIFRHSDKQAHHQSLPRPQFNVRKNPEPNKYVQPLQPRYRASDAMAAKFRYFLKNISWI